MTGEISRGDLLRKRAIGVGISPGPLIVPGLTSADGPESVQVAEIYQLQAGFHRAKSHQDIVVLLGA